MASFDKLAQEYLTELKSNADKAQQKQKGYRYATGVVERYLVPFFGRKNISAIQYKDLVEYTGWRKTYWTTGPGKGQKWLRFERGHKNLKRKAPTTEATAATLRRETSIVRAVFMQGVKRGFLKASDIPKQEVGKVVHKKRTAFTKEQYHHLLEVSETRIMEVSDRPKFLFERYMLHNFIIIAAETGMRTMEMFNLNWGHIVGFEEVIKKPVAEQEISILAHGKGRLPQRFIPRKAAISGFEGIY